MNYYRVGLQQVELGPLRQINMKREGRRCRKCEALLSRYNPGKFCWAHKDEDKKRKEALENRIIAKKKKEKAIQLEIKKRRKNGHKSVRP